MSGIFKRIDTVFVWVKDLEASSKWYEKVLELNSTWRDMEGGYVSFSVGETAITLARVSKPEEYKTGEGSIFNFFASDINMAHRHLSEKGVNVSEIVEDGNVKWFTFNDIEGNKLEVCSF